MQNQASAKLNSATQHAIGYALAWLLDPTPGDRDDVSKLTIKEEFGICREKFSSMNGAPIGRLVLDENFKLRKERAMLAQEETKTKVPVSNCNGKPYKSDGSDTQVAEIKKDLTP